MWYRKKRLYALLLLIVLLALYMDRIWLGKIMYPLNYENEIILHTTTYEVDPYLVAAIIRVESNFTPDKRSPKGAIGLMQLMPPTAEWIIKQEREDEAHAERLDEPALNIRYGVWYLRALRQQFVPEGTSKEDEIALVAAAYNAGPGNVDHWLRDQEWSGTFEEADQIPFGETRHYVHRVYYYYNKYLQTYPELSQAQ